MPKQKKEDNPCHNSLAKKRKFNDFDQINENDNSDSENEELSEYEKLELSESDYDDDDDEDNDDDDDDEDNDDDDEDNDDDDEDNDDDDSETSFSEGCSPEQSENEVSDSELIDFEENESDSKANTRVCSNFKDTQRRNNCKTMKPVTLVLPVSSFFNTNHYFYNSETWNSSSLIFQEKMKFKDIMLMHEYYFFDKNYEKSKKDIFIQKLLLFLIDNEIESENMPWYELFSENKKTKKSFIKSLFAKIGKLRLDTERLINKLKDKIFKTIPSLCQSIKSNKRNINYIIYEKKNQKPITFILLKIERNLAPKLKDEYAFIEIAKMLNCEYGKIENKEYRLKFNCSFEGIFRTSVKKILKSKENKKRQNYKYEKNIRKKKFTIYETQKVMGEKIFEMIKPKIHKFDKYNDFKFYLIVPPRLTLKFQSIERIKQQLKHVIEKCYNFDQNKFVYMAHKKDLDILKKEISNNGKKCLNFIIHDECQWGINSEGVVDFKLLTNKKILEKKNVFVLHISATAYPFDVIENLPDNHKTDWNSIDSIESKYKGLKKLLQENKIVAQSPSSEKCIELIKSNSMISYLNVSCAELSIMIEYVITLHYILLKKKYISFQKSDYPKKLQLFVTKQTEQILDKFNTENHNGKGQLVVLRMQKRKTAQILAKWMKAILKQFDEFILFDVIVDCIDDLNNPKRNLFESLSKFSKEKLKYWDPEKYKTLQNKTIIYDDFINLPMLLILVEKGRCGDTFPENLKYFDLRPRYQSKSSKTNTLYASLKQDVGRAFGYGERPIVFLSSEIKKLLVEDKLRPHQTLKKRCTSELKICNKKEINDEDDYKNEDEKNDEPTDIAKKNNLDFIYDETSNWIGNILHPFSNFDIENLHKRRFLFKAQPQIGKTGSFLYTVELFFKEVFPNKFDDSNKEYVDILDRIDSIEDIEELRNFIKRNHKK